MIINFIMNFLLIFHKVLTILLNFDLIMIYVRLLYLLQFIKLFSDNNQLFLN
jgi:hypothetical protein